MTSQASYTKPIESEEKISGEENAAVFDKWWFLVIGALGLMALLMIFRPDPYLRIFLYVRDGIVITVMVTVISFVLTLIFALFVALARISSSPFLTWISSLYVEIVRGIPLLVQLLFWYFAFPSVIQGVGTALNIDALKNYLASPVAMAVLGLVFCYAAYMSEVYRAGIQSISPGQMEAARSVGMTYAQAMRFVILPQAVRIILPPVGNDFISLHKDSSLISVVAVADMTRRGREFMSTTFLPVQTWLMVALIYLVMTLFAARLVTWVEKKSKTEK